jgi:hypothetical protein
MDRLLIALPEEIHAALGARDVLVEREDDVVGGYGVGGSEEAEHRLKALRSSGERTEALFHCSISRCIEISVGSQWLALPTL